MQAPRGMCPWGQVTCPVAQPGHRLPRTLVKQKRPGFVSGAMCKEQLCSTYCSEYRNKSLSKLRPELEASTACYKLCALRCASWCGRITHVLQNDKAHPQNDCLDTRIIRAKSSQEQAYLRAALAPGLTLKVARQPRFYSS